MSTAQTWQTASTSLEQSLALAAQIGAKLQGGETIELISDLGGGKTAFVRGLAAGLGSTDRVSSPSFTLTNQYTAGDKTLHHFDFYRLSEPGVLKAELSEILTDKQNIVAIEWADIIADVLPADRLQITIRATGENSRQFNFSFPSSLAYLLP
ncbi:MAG: tRNA (adenosine(37)-N6)-threonylcarbamoyltransferase complex ATPase subunit type 1 TsaE [Patescibacteria group bacterium]|nr:tRNA (adenosine(37)-N6)-threonylcarbamoyltransferase complex ATPase subunit type 1 TsaE [Patescibacteria group bacterium]